LGIGLDCPVLRLASRREASALVAVRQHLGAAPHSAATCGRERSPGIASGPSRAPSATGTGSEPPPSWTPRKRKTRSRWEA
jgi:hypothetical protein